MTATVSLVFLAARRRVVILIDDMTGYGYRGHINGSGQ